MNSIQLLLLLLFSCNLYGQIHLEGNWIEDSNYNRIYSFTSDNTLNITLNRSQEGGDDVNSFTYRLTDQIIEIFNENKLFDSFDIISSSNYHLKVIQSSTAKQLNFLKTRIDDLDEELSVFLKNTEFEMYFYKSNTISEKVFIETDNYDFNSDQNSFSYCYKNYEFDVIKSFHGTILKIVEVTEHDRKENFMLVQQISQDQIEGYMLESTENVVLTKVKEQPLTEHVILSGIYSLMVETLAQDCDHTDSVDVFYIKFEFSDDQTIVLTDPRLERTLHGKWEIGKSFNLPILRIFWTDANDNIFKDCMLISNIQESQIILSNINCNIKGEQDLIFNRIK